MTLRAAVIWAAAALGIAWMASAPWTPDGVPPAVAPLLAAHAEGSLRITNSLGGDPIVIADGIVPGRSAGGSVRIASRSPRPIRLTVVRRAIADLPGPNGGAISDVVQVKFERQIRNRARRRHRTARVYQGRLAGMQRVGLGRVPADGRRRYRLSLKMPDGGRPPTPTTGDNAYQGSALSVDFVWVARPTR